MSKRKLFKEEVEMIDGLMILNCPKCFRSYRSGFYSHFICKGEALPTVGKDVCFLVLIVMPFRREFIKRQDLVLLAIGLTLLY